MELIRVSKMINEAFTEGFVKASLHIRDTRNRSHFLDVVYGDDVEEKVIDKANKIGDGSRVLAITFL